jgi:Tat protein secretion system quality control protein TatD with DNase activity
MLFDTHTHLHDPKFDEDREEVIEKTFGCTHEHDVMIEGTVGKNSYNSECHLCYEEAMYQCSKCEYPICDECMKTLKKSTGKCPCCQTYPLILKTISLKDN